jgi:hypothetical protein
LWLPPTAPLPEPATLQEMLAAEAVGVAAVDAATLAGDDVSSALDAAAHVGRCAVLAQSLTCNRVVCDLAIASESLAQEVLGRLMEVLAPVPVLLCLRNRPEDGPDAWGRLLSLFMAHEDRLGFALVPEAAHRAGWDLEGGWDWLLPAIRHLYVTQGAAPEVAAPGADDLDWEALAARFASDGYSGAVSLWLEGPAAFRDPVFAESELKESRFLMENWFHGAV